MLKEYKKVASVKKKAKKRVKLKIKQPLSKFTLTNFALGELLIW